VYILNEARSWKRQKLTAINTIDKRKEDIQWSSNTEDVFTSLKSLLSTAPILCYLGPGGKFTVDTGMGKEVTGGLSP